MNRSRLLTACLALLGVPIFTVSMSTAQQLACPSMPDNITQVNRDVRSEVQVGIGSLGKLKAGEIGVKTDVVAKNLFDKYPNTDRIVVVQMMAATYCSMIRDSKALKDSERLRLWSEFSERVFKFESPAYNPAPPPSPKPKGNLAPADKGKQAVIAETKPSVNQDCAPGANCAQSIGQTGGFTGQLIVEPPQRRIPNEKKGALTTCLSKTTGKFQVSALSGDTNAFGYAQDWYSAFQSAGWTPDGTILSFWIGGGIWYGVQFRFRGSYPAKTKSPYDLVAGSAEENAFKCVNEVVLNGTAIPEPEFPSGLVSISVGPQPPPAKP